MKNMKRVALIVLDGVGAGYQHDAQKYGDVGADTLGHVIAQEHPDIPNLTELGLLKTVDMHPLGEDEPIGCYGTMEEAAAGKDTTTGHWEIAGLTLKKPFPTYPHGFPKEVIDAFEEETGMGTLGNKPASGTAIIEELGAEHIRTGKLIVYTSADSVFQIAANEAIVPVEKLYEICAQARELLTGKYGVGRVIARPFVGDCAANFTRTPRRHDYSLVPPHDTMLDAILAAGKQTIGVGKIHDIFAGKGIGETIRTSGNTEGLQVTLELADRDFEGLAFVNLVDFDMLYGHRRDIAGYAAAAAEFNDWLPGFMAKMRPGDILMVTADHGCDPSYTKTTDHTREHVPFLIYGDEVKPGVNLHTRYSFATIADTVCKALGVAYCPAGCGVYDEIAR